MSCCGIDMCAPEDPLPRKAPGVCTAVKLWFWFWSWSGPVLGLYNDAHNRAIFTIAPMRCAASAPRLPPLRHLTRSMLFWFWFWTEALRHAALLIRESKIGAAGTRFYSARGRWQGSPSEILVATWHEKLQKILTAAHSYRLWSGLKWRSSHEHRDYMRYCNYCNQLLYNNNNNNLYFYLEESFKGAIFQTKNNKKKRMKMQQITINRINKQKSHVASG